MASTLTIVDPTDTSVTLFDLNGTNGAAAGSVTCAILHDPDWGSASLERSTTMSVGETVFTRRLLTPVRLRVRIQGTSYDTLNAGVGRLSALLAEGCTMKWVPNGSAQTLYVDVEPSPTPVVLDGREMGMHKAATLFDTPEGVTLRLLRQPYFRGAALTSVTNLLTNPTLLRDSDDDGDPDGWTYSAGTMTIDTATDSLQIVHNANADLLYQDYTGTGAFTASVEAWQTGGNRVLGLRLISRPSNTTLATTSVTATTPGTRTTVTGTTSGGDTGVRVMLVTTSGSTSSTFKVRNAQLEAGSAATTFRVSSETVAMDPAASGFARYLPVYNPGNAPSPCVLTMGFPDASTQVTEVDLSLRSTRGVDGLYDLGQFLNGPCYAQAEGSADGWTVAFGTDSSNPAGTASDASGSDYAQITHSSNANVMQRRITWTRTTKLDGLRGSFNVYARVLAASARSFELELRYGGGTSGPVQTTAGRKLHDIPEASSFAWVHVPLGTVSFPDAASVALSGVRFELWSRIADEGTAANLYVDYLELRPADDTANVSVNLSGYTETVPGSGLATPVTNPTGGTAGEVSVGGTVPNTAMRLNSATDNCGVQPNTGPIADTGRWRITFDVGTDYALLSGSTMSLTCRVRNITDSTTTASVVVSWTATTYALPGTTRTQKVIEFTAAAGKLYQPQVAVTNYVAGQNFVVYGITLAYVPAVTQSQYIRSDPGSVPNRSAVERLDSTGGFLGDTSSSVAPFWLPPGLSLIGIAAAETTLPGYDFPSSELTRTVQVDATVHPRYWT